jgi:thioredoxin-like negative regulator of GroEL
MLRATRLRALALALFVAAHAACARGLRDEPLTFIADDYARALAQARARHVPLFVDAWAPWCHTCLSLRAYVFPDPALRRFASRFVWLSLDTERAQNASVVERLGVRELPTLFVIDAASEATTLARPGSLTATELATFLDESLRPPARDESRADADLRRARRAAGAGHEDEAIEAYRATVAEAPAEWAGRPEAIDALVTALHAAGRRAECAQTAADAVAAMPPGTARADVLRAGIECAIPKAEGTGESSGDVERAPPARLEALAAFGERVAADGSDPILADDRSDLFDHVVDAWTSLHRPENVRRVAGAWARLLEGEAARATTPAARAVFDAHRVAAYVALGTPERAIPMLEQSARDFPGDYNPPARLGRVFLAVGRPGAAVDALERALRLAYGPRKLSLWSLQADAYLANGDRAGARRALGSALAFADAQPLPPGYRALRMTLARRLDAIP